MKLLVIDIQKGITDSRLFNFDEFIVHIPLERNSQSATAERLSAPNGKFVVS